MSHDTMPVHIRRANGVPVLASATAAQFISVLKPGWNVLDREEAEGVASFCEVNGEANRKEPWFPGERLALQGLARQIRHRLAKKEGR